MSHQIGFVGLGKLGLPCAAAFSVKLGETVWGYDLDSRIAAYIDNCQVPYQELELEDFLTKAKINFATSMEELVLNSKTIFVAVQTPHERQFEGSTPTPNATQDFSYDALVSAVSAVAEVLRSNPEKKIRLVVISTVLPGTMRNHIFPTLKSVWNQVDFFYNPYFIAMGTTIADFLNPEFTLVGADADQESRSELVEIYSKIHNAPIRFMAVESAELTKVAYNTFIGFKIVFANTLAEIASVRGGNVDEVTDALAAADVRLISGKYLSAGMGDGGGCHPRDQIAMSWLAKDAGLSADIFGFLARARDAQTLEQARLISEIFHETKLPVIILGEAYKPNINLTVGSPSLLLSHYLTHEFGVSHEIYDPHTRPDLTFTREPSLFFVATPHQEFLNIRLPLASVVIDPWRAGIGPQDPSIRVVRTGGRSQR